MTMSSSPCEQSSGLGFFLINFLKYDDAISYNFLYADCIHFANF